MLNFSAAKLRLFFVTAKCLEEKIWEMESENENRRLSMKEPPILTKISNMNLYLITTFLPWWM